MKNKSFPDGDVPGVFMSAWASTHNRHISSSSGQDLACPKTVPRPMEWSPPRVTQTLPDLMTSLTLSESWNKIQAYRDIVFSVTWFAKRTKTQVAFRNRQSPIFFFTNSKYFLVPWQLFIILRHPVTISVTVFSNLTKFANDLNICLSLFYNYKYIFMLDFQMKKLNHKELKFSLIRLNLPAMKVIG